MIRILLTSGNKAYGYDVTDYEDQKSESGWYDNLLTEDLLERVGQGDIICMLTLMNQLNIGVKIMDMSMNL